MIDQSKSGKEIAMDCHIATAWREVRWVPENFRIVFDCYSLKLKNLEEDASIVRRSGVQIKLFSTFLL